MVPQSQEGTERVLRLSEDKGLVPYLRVFLRAWNLMLGDTGELVWTVWRDHTVGVIAVVFEIREIGTESVTDNQDRLEWMSVLRRIGLQWEESEMQSILRYGLMRAVTDTAIVVVKRDERHFWTASAARQDVDATVSQVMAFK